MKNTACNKPDWLRRAAALLPLSIFCILPCARADYYVAKNGQTPSAPYTSWSSAALHIQDAVNAAPEGATVWVGAGRYTLPPAPTNYNGTTNVVFIYRPLILRSSNGVPETTIIDGEGKYRGITWYYGSASISNFTLDGLTISNCTSYPANVGGGILFVPNGWTATVVNCIISDNVAVSTNSASYGTGGGIYAFLVGLFGATVSNCVFRNNRATNTVTAAHASCGGFSISSTIGRKLITGCLIENNEAGHEGGGGSLGYYNKTVENCIFRGNRTTVYENSMSGGGGYFGNGIIRNCLFYNNYVAPSAAGGAIFDDRGGLLEVYNCTIVSNRATWGGGIRIRVRDGWVDYLVMSNSVVCSNSPSDVQGPGAVTNFISYSCFSSNADMGVVSGSGNTTNNPLFAGWDKQDYRLTPGSPCLNTGANQDWMMNGIDLDNNRRIRYGTVDMGAYEMIHNATVYRFR